jgi:hypothetical protein
MHAFLIAGNTSDLLEKEIQKLIKKLKVKPIQFKVERISDIRELESLTKLSTNKPTAIVIKNIDKATTEALNAFLKNLEEPQKNIYYILTTTSIYSTLPTILSRCQIINTINNKREVNFKLINEFINSSPSEKIKEVNNIRGRNDAVLFIEEFIFGCHKLVHKSNKNLINLKKYLKTASKTLLALKANGNVNLQLTSFVLNLV